MEEMNVYEMWNQKVNSERDEVRMSVQIRELCKWRDNYDCTFLAKDACQKLLLMVYAQIKFICVSFCF